MDEAQTVVEDMAHWLNAAVVGLNLCPFAKAVHVKQQVRYVVSQATSPKALARELARELEGLAQADPAQTRVSRLPLPLPLATRLLPTLCFDLRQALLIHAQGLSRVLRNTEQRSPRDKAFVMCAELFLMQHTCHWFCKSKTIASARLLARHQTSYDKVLASVSAPTRAAYLKLVGG